MDEQTSGVVRDQVASLRCDVNALKNAFNGMAAVPVLLSDLKDQNKKLFDYFDAANEKLSDIRVCLERKQDRVECEQKHKEAPFSHSRKDDPDEVGMYQKIIKWILMILIPALIGFFGGGALIK